MCGAQAQHLLHRLSRLVECTMRSCLTCGEALERRSYADSTVR
jgi:hypothetical protein